MPEDLIFKCRSLVLLAISYELMAIFHPEHLNYCFLELVQKQRSDFICPCGSTNGAELNFINHFRLRHMEAHKAMTAIRNDKYPFGDIDPITLQNRTVWD